MVRELDLLEGKESSHFKYDPGYFFGLAVKCARGTYVERLREARAKKKGVTNTPELFESEISRLRVLAKVKRLRELAKEQDKVFDSLHLQNSRSLFQENSNPLYLKELLRPAYPSFSLFFPFLQILSCKGIPIHGHIIFHNLLTFKVFSYGIT